MKIFLRYWALCWPAVVWALFGVVLFWPVMGYYDVLPAPDDAPYYLKNAFALTMDHARVAGTSFAPLNFLPALMPPLVAHDFAYLLTPLLMMLAAAWWFTSRGVGRLPALIAGGALGFAGYSFTLVAAGHRGFFDLTVYLMLLLGAMPRALAQQRLFYFALSGAAAGWMLTAQPDFAVVALGVAGLYAAWLLAIGAWRNVRLKFFGGAALALVFFMLASAGSTQNVILTIMPHRQAEMTQMAKANAAAKEGESAQEQWIFATNWSLPPEEALELVAPNYKGMVAGDAKLPYWGRLGRSWKWEETKRGFGNFRQHSLYIGLVPLFIGLFAVVMWVFQLACGSRGRSPSTKINSSSKTTNMEGERHREPQANEDPLRDVPFWATLGVVALVLAFGRYTPFYKLFYSIPHMSLLRAPVKFIRVVEWGSAFCFAAGLTVLLRQPLPQRTAKNMWIALGVCGVVFLALSLMLPAHWSVQIAELNLARFEPALLRNASRAFWHPVWAAAVLAGCVWLFMRNKGNLALAALAVFLAVDMWFVASPYISKQDMRTHYTASPAQAHFDKERELDQLVTQADFVLGTRGHSQITLPLRRAGFGNTTPSPQSDPNSAHVRLAQALLGSGATLNSLVRYVQLTGARFVWLEAEPAQQLARAMPGVVSLVQGYAFDGAALRPSDKPNIALLRMRDALPDAWISTKWVHAATLGEQLAVALGAGYNPLAAPVTDAPALTNAAESAEILSRELLLDPVRGKVAYRATGSALLTVRFGSAARLVATLEDGTRLPLHTSSLFWTGVVVPKGEHTVTFRRDYGNAWYFYASLLAMGLIGLMGLMGRMKKLFTRASS